MSDNELLKDFCELNEGWFFLEGFIYAIKGDSMGAIDLVTGNCRVGYSYFNLNDYFTDFYNPTERELQMFEMLQGFSLPWGRLNKPEVVND